MNKYLVVCIGYECNNDCISCMIGDIKNELKPTSFDEFKKIIDKVPVTKDYDSLIISGAEVTLNDDLSKFIEYAKRMGDFKHIQIQTNGRKLSDIEYCRQLIDSGVDEFYVSIYGSNQETHESLTRTKNSFVETMKGIENLDELNVSIITNTVVTKLNYRNLPEITEKLSVFKNIKRMEFWNYNTMEREDSKDLLESNQNIKPYLLKAIDIGKQKSITVHVMYFPECILEHHSKTLDNSKPGLIIDEKFWEEFEKNEFGQCVFMNICRNDNCLGLTTAYIKKFGWDRNLLKPIL